MGQHNIQQNNIVFIDVCKFFSFVTIAGNIHCKALRPQMFCDGCRQPRIVFNKKYAHRLLYNRVLKKDEKEVKTLRKVKSIFFLYRSIIRRWTSFLRELLISQSINGIEHCCFSCRIKSKEYSNSNRKSERKNNRECRDNRWPFRNT